MKMLVETVYAPDFPAKQQGAPRSNCRCIAGHSDGEYVRFNSNLTERTYSFHISFV